MLWNKEFVGLALEDDVIRVAHLRKEGKVFKIIRLDSYTLAEEISSPSQSSPENASMDDTDADNSAEGVFGFDEEDDEPSSAGNEEEDDLDFEELEAQTETQDDNDLSLDMVNESEGVQSNAVLLYNILNDTESENVTLGLNIQAGNTIFQIIDDTDFREVKTKDLTADVESKLESIYGTPKSEDNYAYHIQDDGSLILASTESTVDLLAIVDESKEIYDQKINIGAIYPDEVALVGLVNNHYQQKNSEITALIQFAPQNGRIVFMQGNEILQVMPTINQGTESSNFLNTVFSKLLFQLDSGKVAGIDKIVIANNTIGEEALEFFSQNFPDITVQNFQYNNEVLELGDTDQSVLNLFTSAIAIATAASEDNEEAIHELSFMPSHVRERQKIFKLQWHGLVLLALIFLSIPTVNYFYQQNAAEIESLSSELELTNSRINQIAPVVQSTNEISQNLSLLTSKLALLDSLSKGSKVWSTKFDLLNEGMNSIPNSWLTSMNDSQSGVFLEGYTLYRNRIPAIVDLFEEATLFNVTIDERREEEIFRFSMIVQEFVSDSSLYSPEKPEEIEQILNN